MITAWYTLDHYNVTYIADAQRQNKSVPNTSEHLAEIPGLPVVDNAVHDAIAQ